MKRQKHCRSPFKFDYLLFTIRHIHARVSRRFPFDTLARTVLGEFLALRIALAYGACVRVAVPDEHYLAHPKAVRRHIRNNQVAFDIRKAGRASIAPALV